MSQRLLRPKSFAALSLLLGGAGLVVAACGSDSNPASDDNPLSPSGNSGANAGTAGSGQGGTGPTGNAGGTAGGTSPSEGQGGNIPIDNNPGQGGSTPNAGGSNSEPPPPTGLAPNCNPPEGEPPDLTLELVAGGLNQPLYVTGVPGDDTRLFIMEKGGAVRVLSNGELQEQPFIDVSGQLQNQNERGLLGMAFHPSYATNGLFYLHYSSNGGQGLPPTGDTVVAEFRVSADNPSVADAASRRIVLTIDQPEQNHNGGEITFGPDGLLYLGFGDGGGGGDQHGAIGNGQSLSTLLGKLLRIDPLGRANGAYSVPPGNLVEVSGQQALPEIWAYGLRNPWRFSFDDCTGDLYIGDVGQDDIEEIDFLAANTDTKTIPAGANFGWRIMEGPDCFDATCNAQTQANLILPIDSYGGAGRESVTGGYVYRGSSVPGLRGTYIYADYVDETFFSFRVENGQLANRRDITTQMRPAGGGAFAEVSSFGTDNAGELYVTAFTPGAVYRVAAAQ